MKRVSSFSAKPEDVEGQAAIKKLKSYSERTGINFSTLVIRAIHLLIKEMNID